MENQCPVLGAGEDGRDSSGEFIPERAVCVDVEGGKGCHLVGRGGEIENQEAGIVGADGDVVAVEVGACVCCDEVEEFG